MHPPDASAPLASAPLRQVHPPASVGVEGGVPLTLKLNLELEKKRDYN